MSIVEPREGYWYADRNRRETFLVINVDEADGIIDLQDEDGGIDEMDFYEWYALDLELVDTPGMTPFKDREHDGWFPRDEGGGTDEDRPSDELNTLRKTGAR